MRGCVLLCIVLFGWVPSPQTPCAQSPPSQPLDPTPTSPASDELKATPKQPPKQAPPVKIGLLVPLRGKHKKLGQAVLDATTFARVDQDGFELVIADTGGTEKGAAMQVDALAADPMVKVILGPVGWKSSRAAAVRAEALKIPLVSLSSQEGLELLGSFVFRGRPSVQEQARLMAKVAVDELRCETFAILHADDPLGELAAEAFFEEVRREGGRVMAFSRYKAGETNLQKSVEELVGVRGPRLSQKKLHRPPASKRRKISESPHVNFEAIFIPDYDKTVALATKFLRFYDVPLSGFGDGSSLQLLGTSHLPGPQLADAEGLLSGALYPEIFHIDQDDEARAYAESFREAYERDPQRLDAQIYDLYASLVQVLSRAYEAAPQSDLRTSLPSHMVGMEPRRGLTGLQWFEAAGTPGYQYRVWLVDSNGQVSPSY